MKKEMQSISEFVDRETRDNFERIMLAGVIADAVFWWFLGW